MQLEYKFSVDTVISQNRIDKKTIEIIRVWLLTEEVQHVPRNLPDELIVLFLLSCGNDVKYTKKTISSHYKFKTEVPEFFSERNVESLDIQEALQTVRMISIPVRTEDNTQLVYFSLRDTNYLNFDLAACMKASYMILDIEHQSHPPDGFMYILNMEGFGVMHLTSLRPELLRKYVAYLREGIPIRFKGLYFLNSSFIVDRVLDVLRLFIKEEYLNGVYSCPEGVPLEDIWSIAPKECLPQELGGKLPCEEELCEQTYELLKAREDFWNNEEKLRKNRAN